MKNKGLFSVFLISILMLVAIPAVSAANYNFDTAMNDFVKIVLNDDAEAAASAADTNLWLPVIIMFFVTFSVLYGGLSMVPFLRSEKFGKRVITILAVFMGIMTIQFPQIYLVYTLFGAFFWILILFVMIALFFTVWGGFSAGWAKSSAEAIKERAAKSKAIGELSKARKDEYGALRDEELALGNIKKERSYLKKLESITKQEIELEEGSLQKLMKLKAWLGQLAATGVRGTEEGDKAKQRIVNIIRTMIPSARKEDEAIKKLKNLTDACRALDIADFKDLAHVKAFEADATDATKEASALVAVRARLEEKSGLHPGDSTVTPAIPREIDDPKAAALAARIMAAIKRKWEFEKELQTFEQKLKDQSQEYTMSLQRMLASLNTEDFTASSAALQEAINLKQQQDRELKGFTKIFGGIESGNNFMMVETLAEERSTARAIRRK